MYVLLCSMNIIKSFNWRRIQKMANDRAGKDEPSHVSDYSVTFGFSRRCHMNLLRHLALASLTTFLL
jgi:hypothetical protein